ncbi:MULTISPECIES: response regulator [unclassified Sphingomonas]|jgi:chemotaxis response regulator CheB|uniref:response regulator n=1 Tax=unclassified Sphingomonas TaxID=196159 RepID=UPI002269D1EE|nr:MULTISPECIES: response regulator [unclassified Sphingomonas]
MIRLLVIDDSATIRALVEQIADADPDCQVVGVAPDVPTARVLIRDRRPNLITLDLNMPGMGGLEFLSELSAAPHAPVIVLSSSATLGSDVVAEALRLGAVACFDKAKIVTEAGRLRKLLRTAIDRHQRKLTGKLS